MTGKRFWMIGLVLLALLAACGGGGGEDTDAAAIERGQALFESITIGDNFAPGCSTCHSLVEGQIIVGPSQFGVATRAAATIADPAYTGSATDVDGYFRESITNPGAYAVDGFDSSLMYANYATDLTEEQIADVIAYMKTLK